MVYVVTISREEGHRLTASASTKFSDILACHLIFFSVYKTHRTIYFFYDLLNKNCSRLFLFLIKNVYKTCVSDVLIFILYSDNNIVSFEISPYKVIIILTIIIMWQCHKNIFIFGVDQNMQIAMKKMLFTMVNILK